MYRCLTVASLVCILLSIGVAVWAQDGSFTPSPHIYKIAAGGCETGPTMRIQSGFRVKNQVGVITALHGVLGCKTIIAEPGGDGQAFRDLIIGKVDIHHDVAVLWSKELAESPFIGLDAITATMTVDQKASYQVIGYPFGLFRQKATIDVKILERTALGDLLTDEAILLLAERNSPALNAKVFSVQTHLVPGHSGAPILNRAGQVVAIGNGGLDLGRVEMGWAIPWDSLELKTVSARVSQQVSWDDYTKLSELRRNHSEVLFSYSTPEPPTSTPTAALTATFTETLTATSTLSPTPQPTATMTPMPATLGRITVVGVGFPPKDETNPALRKQFALRAARVMASANFARWQAGEDVAEVTLVDQNQRELQADLISTEVRAHIPGGKEISQSYDDATGEAQVTVEYVVEVPE